MQLQLPPALASRVRERVESGRYRDEAEVVSEALQLLEWEDGLSPNWDRLGPALEEAEADLAAGRYVDVEQPETLKSSLPPA